MKTTNQLDHLRIASPCPANWDQMSGNDRVRFCDLCNLHVYNIAQLTRREAADLIADTEGRICVRLYRRVDGTIITKDCPVGLRAIRRRVAKIAGAVFAAITSLSGSAGSKTITECQVLLRAASHGNQSNQRREERHGFDFRNRSRSQWRGDPGS